jgi:hypothetical protein
MASASVAPVESAMPLFISCLSDDPQRTRAMLDRLRTAGWPPEAIAVVHPDEPLPVEPSVPGAGAEAAAVAGGSGAAVAGAFGWLVGYGVLAVPAAVLGGALAGAAGAALGTGADEEAALRRSVLSGRMADLRGATAAVVVRVEDARGHDTVTEILRSEGGRDLQVAGRGRIERASGA